MHYHSVHVCTCATSSVDHVPLTTIPEFFLTIVSMSNCYWRLSVFYLLMYTTKNVGLGNSWYCLHVTHRKICMQTRAQMGNARIRVCTIHPPVLVRDGTTFEVIAPGTRTGGGRHGCRRWHCPSGPMFVCTFPVTCLTIPVDSDLNNVFVNVDIVLSYNDKVYFGVVTCGAQEPCNTPCTSLTLTRISCADHAYSYLFKLAIHVQFSLQPFFVSYWKHKDAWEIWEQE